MGSRRCVAGHGRHLAARARRLALDPRNVRVGACGVTGRGTGRVKGWRGLMRGGVTSPVLSTADVVTPRDLSVGGGRRSLESLTEAKVSERGAALAVSQLAWGRGDGIMS